MNKCHVAKDLSAYLDNQLAEGKKLQIEKHLAECTLCSRELARLKALSERLKAWQVPGPGLSFASTVKNNIVLGELGKGEVKMKKKTLAILIPSGALAGILVVAFLGVRFGVRFMQGHMKMDTDDMQPPIVDFNKLTHQEATKLAKAGFTSEGMGVQAWNGTRGANEGVYAGSQQYAQSSMAGRESYEPYYIQSASPAQVASGSVIVIQPTLPATTESEKVIRTAQVKVEVEDGKETYKKASLICQEFGGYLAESRFYRDDEGREAGTIVMRIPKDKFLAALDKINTLGKVQDIATDSQDVSQQYANLKSRLDAAMVVYNKMLEALQKRQTSIDEAARLESELTPVLQRIEQLKNQIDYLNNAISFTTITLTFYEPVVSAKVLKESRRYISQSILSAVIEGTKFLAKALPVAVVVGLLLGIATVIAFALKYWILRLFRRG
jgi:hypothetical protein